jgi:hypothetical protein
VTRCEAKTTRKRRDFIDSTAPISNTIFDRSYGEGMKNQ